MLNQPASHVPFWQKLWMPLATIFVEIFQKEKKWWGSGPIGVTSWKDFSISLKKWRFEIFRTSSGSNLTMSTDYDTKSKTKTIKEICLYIFKRNLKVLSTYFRLWNSPIFERPFKEAGVLKSRQHNKDFQGFLVCK